MEKSTRKYFVALTQLVDIIVSEIMARKNSTQNNIATKVREYMLEHYADCGLSIRQIAGVFHFHENYISNLYKEEYGEMMEQLRTSIEEENLRFVEIARLTPDLKTDWQDDPKYTLPSFMEDELDTWLSELDLPVEFNLDYEYSEENQCMMVDLDLPEIEDLPDTKAVEMADGSVKERQKSLKDLRADYVRCVFGMAVFFAGNILNISPYIEKVCVSAYTQRRNRKGDLADQYIYSVLFRREGFARIDYEKIDPVEFCMGFKNRCNIAATGEMKEIEPYADADIV